MARSASRRETCGRPRVPSCIGSSMRHERTRGNQRRLFLQKQVDRPERKRKACYFCELRAVRPELTAAAVRLCPLSWANSRSASSRAARRRTTLLGVPCRSARRSINSFSSLETRSVSAIFRCMWTIVVPHPVARNVGVTYTPRMPTLALLLAVLGTTPEGVAELRLLKGGNLSPEVHVHRAHEVLHAADASHLLGDRIAQNAAGTDIVPARTAPLGHATLGAPSRRRTAQARGRDGADSRTRTGDLLITNPGRGARSEHARAAGRPARRSADRVAREKADRQAEAEKLTKLVYGWRLGPWGPEFLSGYSESWKGASSNGSTPSGGKSVDR